MDVTDNLHYINVCLMSQLVFGYNCSSIIFEVVVDFLGCEL